MEACGNSFGKLFSNKNMFSHFNENCSSLSGEEYGTFPNLAF